LTPGIAFRESPPGNNFRSIPAGITALDSIKISVPAPGYVFAWANTTLCVDHTLGTRDEIYFNIAEDSGSIIYSNYGFAQVTVPAEVPTQASGWYTYPTSVHRIFYVPGAGTYTYYANCRVIFGAADNDSFFDLQLTAMYLPVAYGAVDLPTEKSPANDINKPTGE
jgi:hypothetical protein